MLQKVTLAICTVCIRWMTRRLDCDTGSFPPGDVFGAIQGAPKNSNVLGLGLEL